MTFELRDHTADVAVAATADTLGGVFAAVADGLAAAACETVPADGDRLTIEVTAENREALLFDYLDRLIYRRDVDGVLPVDNEATVNRPGRTGEWHLTGSARGVPLEAVTARDVKAVTYSDMRVERTADGWEANVVFDV